MGLWEAVSVVSPIRGFHSHVKDYIHLLKKFYLFIIIIIIDLFFLAGFKGHLLPLDTFLFFSNGLRQMKDFPPGTELPRRMSLRGPGSADHRRARRGARRLARGFLWPVARLQGCGITRGLSNHFCDTFGNPLFISKLVFGRPFLLYHRSGHFPQPCTAF